MADFPDDEDDLYSMLAMATETCLDHNPLIEDEDDEEALAVARESEQAILEAEENSSAKRKLFNTPIVNKDKGDEFSDDGSRRSHKDESSLERSESSPLAKRMRMQSPVQHVLDVHSTDLDVEVPRDDCPAPSKVSVLAKLPMEEEFVRITASEAAYTKSYYITLKKELHSSVDFSSKDPRRRGSFDRTRANLCSLPYSKLCDEATAILTQQANGSGNENDFGHIHGNRIRNSDCESLALNELWSEKHRPKSYNVLLSDDSTNRALLTWLRLWDKIVFNIPFKLKEKKSSNEGQQGVSFSSSDPKKIEAKGYQVNGNKAPFKKSNSNGFSFSNSETESLIKGVDKETGRPIQPIALLHGPPGLGKTTLAHVIARHAGYSVVELNASDDRTLANFKEKIENALMTKSINGANTPKCLVIDEIDGAPANSINYLVQLLENRSSNTDKKGKKKSGLLLRPVISICNDVYTPALRSLRKIALLLPFRTTSTPRLVSRLQQISRVESMIASATTLRELVLRADGDIRSCLATLHFFKNNNNNNSNSNANNKRIEFRMADVLTANVGKKDDRKSLFALWKSIFEIPRLESSSTRPLLPPTHPAFDGSINVNKRRKGIVGASSSNNCNPSSISSRYGQTLKNVQSCSGQYDRLMEGIFEYYPVISYKDHKLHKLQKCLESMICNDLIQRHINKSQSYSLMAYLPFAFVNIHLLLATSSKAKIAFPQTAIEKRNAKQRVQNVVQSFINGLDARKRTVVYNELVHLVLPYFTHILEPSLRPVNKTLYNNRERMDFDSVLNTMIAYNLSYVQQVSLDGKYDFKLDPPVYEATHLPGIGHASLPYIAKQLISREVELQMMKIPSNGKGEDAEESVPVRVKSKSSIQQGNGGKSSSLSSSSVRDTCPLDFFGRPIQPKSQKSSDHCKKSIFSKSDVWFKFKEGHNNAVRKHIKIRDLI